MNRKRAGVTLIEVLIVIAIIGILIGIILAAVQNARLAASKTQSVNNLKQIMLASQSYLNEHKGQFYGSALDMAFESVPFKLLPYLELGNYDPAKPTPIKVFLNPADSTVISKRYFLTSYALNAQVFYDMQHLNILESIADGQSNTIAIAEHYSVCNEVFFAWTTNLGWSKGDDYNARVGTFADSGNKLRPFMNGGGNPAYLNITIPSDVYPVTEGNPPISVGSTLGLTFQVQPSISKCNIDIAQTIFPVMPVAMFDGSVRLLNGGMSEETYWGAVTPRGGEVLGSDW